MHRIMHSPYRFDLMVSAIWWILVELHFQLFVVGMIVTSWYNCAEVACTVLYVSVLGIRARRSPKSSKAT